MQQRIFGLENEYGLIFSPNGKIYLPMEKVLGYIFEGLIPNSWPSNVPGERCAVLSGYRLSPRVLYAGVRQHSRLGDSRQGGRAPAGSLFAGG